MTRRALGKPGRVTAAAAETTATSTEIEQLPGRCSHVAEAVERALDVIAEQKAEAERAARERLALRRQAAEIVRKVNRFTVPEERPGTCGRRRGGRVHAKRARGGEYTGMFWNSIETCGSIHACLSCGSKIRAHRSLEIEHYCFEQLKAGAYVTMVTLTVPHYANDRLLELIGTTKQTWLDRDDPESPIVEPGGGVKGAWRVMSGSRRWRAWKTEFQVFGLIRADEFTHGVNGWHPHMHVLVFHRKDLGDPENGYGESIFDFRAELVQMWDHAVEAKLDGRRISGLVGVDVIQVRDDHGVGMYVSKVQYEIARSDLKGGRKTSRASWQVAVDAGKWGEKRDFALWAEFHRATKGNRAMSISKSLRDAYPWDGPELTDEEIAAMEVEGDVVFAVDGELWDAMQTYRGRQLCAEALTVGEDDGVEAVAEHLDEYLRERNGPVIVVADEDGLPVVKLRSNEWRMSHGR